MTSNHKVSYSNHKLFQDALRWTQRYVTLSRVFGLLLLIGAGHVLVSRDQDGPHVDVGGGGPDEASLVAQTIQRRSAAIGMVTTGVMGLLVSVMVGRCCRYDRDRASVAVNWHDLFKYTHLGRTMTAAMTAVLTWRGLRTLEDIRPARGGIDRVSVVLIAGAMFSMATAAVMHFMHFRMKKVYAEYATLSRAASRKNR